MSSSGKTLGLVEMVVGAVLWEFGGEELAAMGEAMFFGGLFTEISILLMPTPASAGQDGIIRSSVASQQILYGQVCTGGVLQFSSSYGSNGNNTNAYMVVTVSHSLTRANSAGTAGMPIEGIQGYYINDVYVPVNTGSGGWNSGRGNASGTGACAIIAGTSQPFNNLAGNLWISFSDGSQTTADPVLTSNFTSVDSHFIGLGLCYSTFIMFMSADQPTFTGAFPSGINTPNTIRAVIAGQKIYDPRLDTDNGGSGSQRINSSTTWTFSSNSALIAADYLTRAKTDGGCGYSPGTYLGSSVINSQVNWVAVAAAANICDESITVPAYGATWGAVSHLWSNTDTVARYTFNACIDTAQPTDKNLQEILKTMAGYIIVSNGQIYMYAGATTVSSGDFDESFLAGGMSLQPQVQRNQMYNAVKLTYGSEPQADYCNAQGMPIINATYEAADGNVRLWFNDTIKGCNNQFSCQILEIIKSRQSRNKQIIRAKCNAKMLAFQCGDVLDVTIGELQLTAAPFRIMQFSMSSDLTINVMMVQENAGVYDLPATPDQSYQAYTVSTYESLYNITPSAPGAPTALSASALASGNLVQWVPPAPATYDYIELYRSSTSPGSGGYAAIAKIVGDSFTDTSIVNGTEYWYYVVAMNYWSVASATPALPVSGASCTAVISAANATKGAQLGTNLVQSDGLTVVSNQDQMPDGLIYIRSPKQGTNRTAWDIPDPTFQTGTGSTPPAGWTILTNSASSTLSYQSSGPSPVYGSQYLQLKSGAATGYTRIAVLKNFTAIENDKIAFGGTAAAVGANGTVFITLRTYNAAGTQLEASFLGFNTGGFSALSTTYTVPDAATSYATIEIELSPTAVNQYGQWNLVWATVNDLRVSGSGIQLGDARNGRGIFTAGVQYYLSGLALSNPSSGNITCTAGTLLMGGSGTGNVSYNSSSATGLTNGTLYYVYYQDTGFAGGSKTLNVTTNKTNLAGNPDIIYLGYITPASGGGGGGGIGGCVYASAYLDTADGSVVQAQNATQGLILKTLDDKGVAGTAPILNVPYIVNESSVQLTTANGSLIVSDMTPVNCRGGSFPSFDTVGEEVWTNLNGGGGWEKVLSAQHVGACPVMRISLGGLSFGAGQLQNDYFIYSHNGQKP